MAPIGGKVTTRRPSVPDPRIYHLRGHFEGGRQLLSGVEARLEPAEGFRLVFRTGEDANCSGPDRYHWVARRVAGEGTAGTPDPARRAMIQELGRVSARESTDGGELFEMVVTADERNRELIQEEVRHRVVADVVECRFACLTLDRWIAIDVLWLLAGGICRSHSNRIDTDWTARRVSDWK